MTRKYAYYLFVTSLFLAVLLGHFFTDLWLNDGVRWTVWGACLVGFLVYLVSSLGVLGAWLKKRQAKFGMGFVVSTAAILLILSALNWFAVVENKKWDLTRSSIHSLSDQSIKILEGLKEKVSLRVWSTNVSAMSGQRDMNRFFENYNISGGDQLELEILNPINDPQGAKVDEITRDNVIIVKSASGREVRINNYNDSKAEEQITNAIIQSIKGQQKTMCFTAGHGELSINKADASGLSFVKEALERSSYKTEEITLLAQSVVPVRCEVLVIAGPETEPAEVEFEMIKSYLAGGGKLMALFGVGVPKAWHTLVNDFGVKVEENIVIDPRVQRPPLSVFTQNYSPEVEIVKSFANPVFFTFANSIKVPTQSEGKGLKIKTFISSEDNSYAKSGNLQSVGRDFSRKGTDLSGPLPIAVLISKKILSASASQSSESEESPKKEKTKSQESGQLETWQFLKNVWKRAQFVSSAHAQEAAGNAGESSLAESAAAKEKEKKDEKEMAIVLFGNHLFAANGLVTQMGNMDLFLNSANFLFKDSDLIGIRPKDIGSVKLDLKREQLLQVRGYIIFAVLAFVFVGFSVVRKRRVSAA